MLQAIVISGMLLATDASSPTCSLSSRAGTWLGSCTKLIEETDGDLNLASAHAISSGVWRRDAKPRLIWAGTVKTTEYPPTPVELEIYGEAEGVMRTAFGWFPVAHFSDASGIMRFDVDTKREVAPSSVDREIIERASRILSQVPAWNRSDNRKCPVDAKKWSIYCAMERATIEAAGAFHHRRPALEIVRQIVDERTKDRPYDHRLMDYNNDPTTQLSDVQSLFSEALKRADAKHPRT